MKTLKEINGLKICQISSSEDGEFFFAKMGKFFASKSVRREFDGYPINDDENCTWFVTFSPDEQIIAFAGLSLKDLEKKGIAAITEDYVVADHRGEGLYSVLYDCRMSFIKEVSAKRVKVVANPLSAPIFEKKGFYTASMRGKYAYMELEVLK